MHGADAVTKVRSVVASGAPNGSMPDCKDNRIALRRKQDFNAGLLTRALLSEDKFAACKIPGVLTQEKSDLKWKYNVTVEVLVQAVKITGAVFQ
jgi:hypothetical protein